VQLPASQLKKAWAKKKGGEVTVKPKVNHKVNKGKKERGPRPFDIINRTSKKNCEEWGVANMRVDQIPMHDQTQANLRKQNQEVV